MSSVQITGHNQQVSFDQVRDRILHALEQSGVNQPCPRCQNDSFTLIEGFHYIPIHSEIPTGKGMPAYHTGAVPVVLIGCDRCGNIFHHSLGVLGILDSEEE